MPVTEYNVTNRSDVVNPPGQPYDVAGVEIAPGETRNLIELGATLEQIARDETLTLGILAGDLVAPPQTWFTSDVNDGDSLVPGGVYLVSPATTIPLSLALPPAESASQVPLALQVINAGAFPVELVLTAGNTAIPAGPIVVSPGDNVRLWSFFDGTAWGYTVT